jgi:hypothetical protein
MLSTPRKLLESGTNGLLATPRKLLEGGKMVMMRAKNGGRGKSKGGSKQDSLARLLGQSRALPPPNGRRRINSEAVSSAANQPAAAPKDTSAVEWIIEHVPIVGGVLAIILEFDYARDSGALLVLLLLLAAGVYASQLAANRAMDAVFKFASSEPVEYLALNFGIVALIGVVFLFLKDMHDLLEAIRSEQMQAQRRGEPTGWFQAAVALWQRRQRRLRQPPNFHPVAGREPGMLPDTEAVGVLGAASPVAAEGNVFEYHELVDATADGDVEAGPSLVPALHEERAKGVGELRSELRAVRDSIEELEIRCRVNAHSELASAVAMREELQSLEERRQILEELLESGNQQQQQGSPQQPGSPQQLQPSQQQQPQRPPLLSRVLQSSVMQVLMRSANGFLTVSLYFADIWSDVQVIQLLWTTGNYGWSVISVALLVIQFVVVYLRVIPYLVTTFGSGSLIHLAWIWLGCPLGLLVLDLLMFLEPFGLLAVLPFPDWLRQFVPAYKATRIIAEIAIESLPQCVFQSYIYISVVFHSRAGTASATEAAMLDNVTLFPTSIFVSTLATLKTWIELVHGAREAGLTVEARAIQMWQVGAGLPLDALKKGAIVEWRCPCTRPA